MNIHGRLAQLVEQFVYTEKVGGSIPSSPTKNSVQTLLAGNTIFVLVTLTYASPLFEAVKNFSKSLPGIHTMRNIVPFSILYIVLTNLEK